MSITNVIPLYFFCTETLKETAKTFDKDDEIYIGIEAAIQKLEHYYDKVSPMVGLALILDPRMKIGFLRSVTQWKEEWVNGVNLQFQSAYEIYKSKHIDVQASSTVTIISESRSCYDSFDRFYSKRLCVDRESDTVTEEEFHRQGRKYWYLIRIELLEYYKVGHSCFEEVFSKLNLL